MTYTIAVCTVQNSWWCSEELSETCRVLFQNKFEKLVLLVGIIIRINLYLYFAWKKQAALPSKPVMWMYTNRCALERLIQNSKFGFTLKNLCFVKCYWFWLRKGTKLGDFVSVAMKAFRRTSGRRNFLKGIYFHDAWLGNFRNSKTCVSNYIKLLNHESAIDRTWIWVSYFQLF